MLSLKEGGKFIPEMEDGHPSTSVSEVCKLYNVKCIHVVHIFLALCNMLCIGSTCMFIFVLVCLCFLVESYCFAVVCFPKCIVCSHHYYSVVD